MICADHVNYYPDLTFLPVLVPAENSHWSKIIIRGSAMVSLPLTFKHGKTLVHYEENKCGNRDMERFADKCFIAFSRGLVGYPTNAVAIIAPMELIEVGSCDINQKVVAITNVEPFWEWCGWEKIKPAGMISIH
jgi:hypothetical protein